MQGAIPIVRSSATQVAFPSNLSNRYRGPTPPVRRFDGATQLPLRPTSSATARISIRDAPVDIEFQIHLSPPPRSATASPFRLRAAPPRQKTGKRLFPGGQRGEGEVRPTAGAATVMGAEGPGWCGPQRSARTRWDPEPTREALRSPFDRGRQGCWADPRSLTCAGQPHSTTRKQGIFSANFSIRVLMRIDGT